MPTVKKEPAALQQLRVAKTYSPEQDGAKRFAKRHGENLVCVRHRMSGDGLTRYTTVELLAETTPVATRNRSLIALRIPDSTKSMRSLLLACGATWDAKNKLWLIPHMVAKGLRLLKYRAELPG
ncbi:MAG: hypothetical protein KA711_15030 [Ideonella sp. WA131b]|jgi:hypothetical protein|nr:hypothetical protein [Ideonella sp. WA131b]